MTAPTKIVLRVEDGEDRRDILATTYQMRDFYKQLGDGFFTNLDTMNYIQHHHAVQAIRKGDRVLDICCGRGLVLPLIRFHQKDAIGEYVGVDISAKNIREAQTRARGRDLPEPHETFYPFPHRWVLSNVATMSGSLPAQGFDYLIYTSAIEHMHKDAGAASLREAYKVAAPGARLLLSCPRTPEEQDGYDTRYRAHVYEWKLSELREELRASGWRIEKEIGLVANVRDLDVIFDQKRVGPWIRKVYQDLKDYLPREWFTALLAAPFPEIAGEILIWARKG